MASLERVTYRKYVVGPRPSARDRTAGDSSPVTEKGRSAPGTPGADRNRSRRMRRHPSRSGARRATTPHLPVPHHLHAAQPPAPLPLGTAAALTPVPIPKGPAATGIAQRGPCPAPTRHPSQK
ncbi:hypothetical protein GCM10010272_37650 [Streptomyces lateritius]|nr:hypothetical protein GCM10010272_37650 [Streptomyces lateritius]